MNKDQCLYSLKTEMRLYGVQIPACKQTLWGMVFVSSRSRVRSRTQPHTHRPLVKRGNTLWLTLVALLCLEGEHSVAPLLLFASNLFLSRWVAALTLYWKEVLSLPGPLVSAIHPFFGIRTQLSLWSTCPAFILTTFYYRIFLELHTPHGLLFSFSVIYSTVTDDWAESNPHTKP